MYHWYRCDQCSSHCGAELLSSFSLCQIPQVLSLQYLNLEQFLQELGISLDDYEKSLKISTRGDTIILKRTIRERMVNNYNGKMLKVWNANMDVQFCLDNFAIVTYVCDYLTKTDDGLTKFMKEAIKDYNDGATTVITKSGNDEVEPPALIICLY